ncbi:hypothetical protein O181_010341 [Austropuccinia psidii MF-1]|uniref:Uncharacterized protein n=1 Tax=Austropuccinia psidii MF-1 TaxID=1389203 RepID=A0A9Q3BQU7_9BASI|nr:hypothetical protein [Austropuccinia psidii MF-1]
MANETDTKHIQHLPLLTKNFSEWRKWTIGLLWKKKVYIHCIEKTVPSISAETCPSSAYKKIINCSIIANSLDSNTSSMIVIGYADMENAYLLWKKLTNLFTSSTFNIQEKIWSRFSKISYNGNLQSFITELRKSLNEIKTVGIEVRTKTVSFSILTKVPHNFSSLNENVTLNTKTQGKPFAIFNLLHNAGPKEESLKASN